MQIASGWCHPGELPDSQMDSGEASGACQTRFVSGDLQNFLYQPDLMDDGLSERY